MRAGRRLPVGRPLAPRVETWDLPQRRRLCKAIALCAARRENVAAGRRAVGLSALGSLRNRAGPDAAWSGAWRRGRLVRVALVSYGSARSPCRADRAMRWHGLGSHAARVVRPARDRSGMSPCRSRWRPLAWIVPAGVAPCRVRVLVSYCPPPTASARVVAPRREACPLPPRRFSPM